MILINFSHPLTPEQIQQTEALSGEAVSRIVDLPVHFDNDQPFLPQLSALMNGLRLSSEELQSEPLLVNLPSLNYIAGLVLAELHGRTGYFPPILRLRPEPDRLTPRYEVTEILNLNQVRSDARKARYE